jgi:hypothetical protein
MGSLFYQYRAAEDLLNLLQVIVLVGFENLGHRSPTTDGARQGLHHRRYVKSRNCRFGFDLDCLLCGCVTFASFVCLSRSIASLLRSRIPPFSCPIKTSSALNLCELASGGP